MGIIKAAGAILVIVFMGYILHEITSKTTKYPNETAYDRYMLENYDEYYVAH